MRLSRANGSTAFDKCSGVYEYINVNSKYWHCFCNGIVEIVSVLGDVSYVTGVSCVGQQRRALLSLRVHLIDPSLAIFINKRYLLSVV